MLERVGAIAGVMSETAGRGIEVAAAAGARVGAAPTTNPSSATAKVRSRIAGLRRAQTAATGPDSKRLLRQGVPSG